jgi:hypothetical protein
MSCVENCYSILEEIIRLSYPNILLLQIACDCILLPALEAPAKQAPIDVIVKTKTE